MNHGIQHGVDENEVVVEEAGVGVSNTRLIRRILVVHRDARHKLSMGDKYPDSIHREEGSREGPFHEVPLHEEEEAREVEEVEEQLHEAEEARVEEDQWLVELGEEVLVEDHNSWLHVLVGTWFGEHPCSLKVLWSSRICIW